MKELLKFIKDNPKVSATIITTITPGIFAAAAATFEMYRAYATGAEWGKSYYAIEQKALWENNLPCMQNSKFSYITNNHKVEIGTVVCETGDVLISAKKPGQDHPAFKWVSWGKISTDSALNIDLISTAEAGTILSQHYNEKGELVQEVQEDDGSCIRYYINPYNGQVTYSEPC